MSIPVKKPTADITLTYISGDKPEPTSEAFHNLVAENLAHYPDCPWWEDHQVCLCDFSDYLGE